MVALLKVVAGWLERFPDTPAFFERHISQAWRQYAVCLLLGLALRCATFGDSNLHVDEAFYFMAGQEMHRGAVLYVDLWDRKPVGLFLIYYAIAGISTAVVAYQLAAWLFASSTAMVINLIARRWAGTQGGLLAAASYLFMLGPQEGYGGQSPVFYNLLIAVAPYLLLEARPQLEAGRATWRVFVAMGLCGLALTVKQTTLFESVYFGLFAVHCLWRSPASAVRTFPTVLGCVFLGAFPTVLTGVTYYWIGHWPEFWQAMVLSNLAKAKSSVLIMAGGALRMCLRVYPYLGLSGVGVWLTDREAMSRKDRWFMGLWVLSAVLGVVAVPNFYGHYSLPLLVPLAVTSSLILGRRDVGLFLTAMLVLFTISLFNPFDRAGRLLSMQSMERMATAIKAHDAGGGLLVFDGPPYLYALSGKRPLTPFAFPHHMNHAIERNVSQLDTLVEVQRVLHDKPGVVVIAAFPSNLPANGDARKLVKAYVANNCRIVEAVSSYEINHRELIAIYGDCREGAPDLAP